MRDQKPEKDTRRLSLGRWGGHVKRNVGSLLPKRLWETAAPPGPARRREPHTCGCRELGSANNPNALRHGFFPKLPGKRPAWLAPGLPPAETLRRKPAGPTRTPPSGRPVFLL